MTCPICGKETVRAFRPFCSKRCREIDLGRWLTGSYVIPGDEGLPTDDNADDNDRPPAPRRH